MRIPTCLLAFWLALASGAARPAAALVQESDAGGLDAALETIRADRISADIHFIASNELRGRDTPSPGLRLAARYIRSRVERLGLQPGAGEDDYFWEYPVHYRRLDTEKSYVRFDGSGDLVFGEDYFFFNTSSARDLEAEGPIVFGGSGDRSELEALDLEGRWVLCFASDELSTLKRRNNVRRRDAAGLIVMPRPFSGDDPFPGEFGKVAARCLKGSASLPRGGPPREKRAIFPQVFLSRAAGLRLFEAAPARGEASAAAWEPKIGQELGLTFAEKRSGGGLVDVENVCALWPGSDPELSKEVIIVSAHYDHIGARGGLIWNGADDNGSGTCGLLALAEALVAHGPMRRTVLLLWVSGEEKGLWGSRMWTLDPALPEGARPVCDINIDMIGRNAPDYLLITPTAAMKQYNGLVRLAEANAPLEGFGKLGSCDEYWRRSDHMNFSDNLKIPVTFLFSDVHQDYHQPTDTPDKIDTDKVRRVTRLVMRMLAGLQEDELKL